MQTLLGISFHGLLERRDLRLVLRNQWALAADSHLHWYTRRRDSTYILTFLRCDDLVGRVAGSANRYGVSSPQSIIILMLIIIVLHVCFYIKNFFTNQIIYLFK